MICGISTPLAHKWRQIPAVILTGILLATCAACAAAPGPNVTPTQAEQAQLRELARVATVSERVGALVESLQTTEIALHSFGKITREDHRVVQLSLKIAAETVIDALERLKDLTQTEATRRQWIGIARRAVERLINEGIVPIADPSARIELRLLATAISSILLSLELMADTSPALEVAWAA